MKDNNFDKFHLEDRILKALKALGYMNPTKVQSKVIPLALSGKDVIVKSQTGSGKTAAFAIPICHKIEIEKKKPQTLVLAPTRELAVQLKEEFSNIGRLKGIRCEAIFGKQPIEQQTRNLRQRVHIVVGTPGRTLDHIQKGNINLEEIEYLVIDEADKMLNMGFIEQVKDILTYLPKDRTNMLFSATMPERIIDLCEEFMNNPSLVEAKSKYTIEEVVNQYYYEVEEREKVQLLEKVVYVYGPNSCIIFCNTRNGVDSLVQKFNIKSIGCNALHGGMSQEKRLEIMEDFKKGVFPFLIATDVAARGIDIENIGLVVNFDVPVEKENYVHRIGRTGRAGKKGIAITFVSPNELGLFNEIKAYLQLSIEKKEMPSPQEVEQGKGQFQQKMLKQPKEKYLNKRVTLDKEVTKIYIKAGKDKKVRAGDILGAITNIGGVSVQDVGIIDVQDNISYVDILNGKGKLVLKELPKSTIKGKKVKVERALVKREGGQ